MIEQEHVSAHLVTELVCATHISPHLIKIAVCSEGKWTVVSQCPIINDGRHVKATLGVNHNHVPAKQRMQLKKAGFNLRHM
jgi:hypothetical protein